MVEYVVLSHEIGVQFPLAVLRNFIKEFVMSKLYLSYEERSHGGGICAGQEGSEWPDYEPTHIDWSPTSLSLDKGEGWYKEELEVDFPVKRDDVIDLLVVRYYTGCTFSTTHGCWCIIGLYKDPEEARKIRDSILDETYESPEGYIIWDGYFEGLESCDIHTFRVQ